MTGTHRFASYRAMAVTIAVAICLFTAIGHGLHAAMPEMEPVVPAELTAICLVLFTVLAPLSSVLAATRRRPTMPAVEPAPSQALVPAARQVSSARASPAVLQRFLQ